MGKNEEIFPQCEGNTHNIQKREGKQLSKLPLREEMEDVGEQPNGHVFWGVNFPQKSKNVFPKMGSSPNSNF